MLVLTRRLGEAITIGDDIKIVIVDLDTSQVKIGIEAPRSVEVYASSVRGLLAQIILPYRKYDITNTFLYHLHR